MKISVLMGIYNCAPTLQEALDSLYAQTFQDFKIILCDDGSKDNTYQVAEANAKLHPNIVLIRNERNMGLNYTLNHCLEYADTEYCARMDGDDISLPTRFEKELAFLESHPEYAIVSTPMIRFDEEGVFAEGKGGYEPSKNTFIYGAPFCHAPCMIRAEAYLAVGGYSVDEKLLRVEDYHLWMKMYEKGYRGYVLDECLYKVREDRNNMLKKRKNSLFKDIFHNNETYARMMACKKLKLPLMGYLYSFLPILKRLMPQPLYVYLHKKKLQK